MERNHLHWACMSDWDDTPNSNHVKMKFLPTRFSKKLKGD